MAGTYTRKGRLITTHCAFYDFLENLKDRMDPRHVSMIENELLLAETILRHITKEDDIVQIDHLDKYLHNIDLFLGKIWKEMEPSNRPFYLLTTTKGVSNRLEAVKGGMELKYSSVAAAELKLVNGCLEQEGTLDDQRALEHLNSVVNNVDLYMSKALEANKGIRPKK